MEFEDWTREIHKEFEELRQKAKHKRKMIAISAISAILLLGVILFVAFAR